MRTIDNTTVSLNRSKATNLAEILNTLVKNSNFERSWRECKSQVKDKSGNLVTKVDHVYSLTHSDSRGYLSISFTLKDREKNYLNLFEEFDFRQESHVPFKDAVMQQIQIGNETEIINIDRTKVFINWAKVEGATTRVEGCCKSLGMVVKSAATVGVTSNEEINF
jgi:hypothetical protein